MNKKIKLFLGSLLLLQLSSVRTGQVFSWSKPSVELQTPQNTQSMTDDEEFKKIFSQWQDPDPGSHWDWVPDQLPDPYTITQESQQYGFQGRTIRVLTGIKKNGTLIGIEQKGLLIKGATANNSDRQPQDRLFFHHARNYQIIIEDPVEIVGHSMRYPDIRLCCLSQRGDIGIAWKCVTQNGISGQITRDDYVSLVPFAAIETNNKINLYEQKTIDYGTEKEVIVGDITQVYQFQKLLFNAIASKLGVVFNTLQQKGSNPGNFQSGSGDLKMIDVLSEISTLATAREILQSKLSKQQENSNNNNSSKG